MSPNQGPRWTTWDTISSGFREIELRGDRLESVGLVAPCVAPSELELAHPGKSATSPVRKPARYQPLPSRSMRADGIDQARRRAIARSPNFSRTGIHNAATGLIEVRSNRT
jgi:hypothetical protein